MGSDFVLPLIIAALVMVGIGVGVYAVMKRRTGLAAFALLPLLFAAGFGGPGLAPAAAADPCAPTSCSPDALLDDVVLTTSGWDSFALDGAYRYLWLPSAVDPEEPDAASVANDEAALNALLNATTGLPETLSLTVNYISYASGEETGENRSLQLELPYELTGSPFTIDVSFDSITAALEAASPERNNYPLTMIAVISVPYNGTCGLGTITVNAPVFLPV